MQYIQYGVGSQYAYPNHDIDPSKKDAKWCMQYAEASYYDFTYAYPKGVFANNAGDYDKFRMYALGKQSITPYKKLMGVDQLTDNTWLSVDWSVRAIVSGYRDKAISRLMKEDYDIVCTAVDSQSKTDLDDYYAKLKVKLMVRQLMEQQNPDLANHPMIAMQPGDPSDIEELEMRVMNGEQFNRSKDAEMAIDLGFYENDYKSIRRQFFEDLFDFGVAGRKCWLGDDNKAKFRRVDPNAVIISFAKDPNFKDIVHAGEVIEVSLLDLATVKDKDGNLVFDEKELEEFAGSIAGKFGNPLSFGRGNVGMLRPYDKFKCKVLDIEFYTYNDNVYRDAPDSNGNPDFRKADYGRGKKSDKYTRKKVQYVYKCKWIIGTEKCYDWGMCYDQLRTVDIKKKAKTKLSYDFCAYNFYNMKAQGFMEKLIPYVDDYQLTMLKIQNWKNRAVPSGWWFNLDMLENVALSKGGKGMQPKELIQMFFDSGVMIGRSLQNDGQPFPGNIQPIIAMENSSMSELATLYNEIINIVTAIEKMTGYNDITSGNPNPKTLTPGYELANQSTSDALYPMAFAEEHISTNLAEDVFCRMQQGIKKGSVTGYAPYSGALGANTLRFIELDESLPLRDYGIELQKRSTEQEKNWIFQMIQQDIMNGFLDVSDAIQVIYTKNAKQAISILAYRVKKSKEAQSQQKMAEIQAQNQGLQQQAQMSQQTEMQKIQMEYQFKLQLKQMEVYMELEKKRMETQTLRDNNVDTNQARVATQHVANQGKVVAQSIATAAKNEEVSEPAS